VKLDQLVGSQGSIVTEPRAVATGRLLVEKVSMRQHAGRYRSRFCNAGELRVLIAPLRQRGFADK